MIARIPPCATLTLEEVSAAAYALLIDPYGRRTLSEGDAPAGFPADFTSVFDAGMG